MPVRELTRAGWIANAADAVGPLRAILSSYRNPREAEADRFAQECLIPSADYERFCCAGNSSIAVIRRFAGKIGIAAGIVAGRLQHERKVPFSRANQLKRRLLFAE